MLDTQRGHNISKTYNILWRTWNNVLSLLEFGKENNLKKKKQVIMKNKKGSKKLASRRYSDKIKLTKQGKQKELCRQHQIKKKYKSITLIIIIIIIVIIIVIILIVQITKKLMPTFQKESLQLKLSVKVIKFKGF